MAEDTELLQQVKDFSGSLASGVSDLQLSSFIEAAQAYVGTFKPPEMQEALLVKLWVAHLLTSKTSQISSVKVNNVQINHESGSSDDWFKQFWALIKGLGLGLAEVNGF